MSEMQGMLAAYYQIRKMKLMLVKDDILHNNIVYKIK
jgi:hypothetical protein